MNPNVAIAYAPENQKAAEKIVQDFRGTSIHFTLVSSKEYTDASIFSQLEHFQGPILLLISVNFLQSLACMQHSLSLVTKKSDQLVPILVNGFIPDPETGDLKEVPTAIDKIGDIIPYINYWQSQYLEARSHKSEIRSEEAEKIKYEHYSNTLRMVSSEAGESLRHLRKYSPPTLAESRSLKNRYQSVQDMLIDFPFQENLFLEDEREITDHTSDLPSLPPIPPLEYKIFEEEEVNSEVKDDVEVHPDTDKESEIEVKAEELNFSSAPPLPELDILPNLDPSKMEDDALIDDNTVSFPPPLPILPMGTVDLTIPPEHASSFEDLGTIGEKEEEEFEDEIKENQNTTAPDKYEHEEPIGIEEISVSSELSSNLDAAVSLFKQVKKQYPLDTNRQFFHLKLILKEVEDDAGKLNHLLPFVEKNPNFLDSKVLVSKIYQSQNKWEEAKTILEEILLTDKLHAESLYELAAIIIKYFPDRMERAGDLLHQCLNQSDYPKEALYTYGLYLSKVSNKPYKALEYFLKTIEANPEHKFAHYDIATFYFNEGEKKIAREFYLRAVQNNPELKIPDNDLAFDVHPA